MRVRNTRELGILIRDARKSRRWSQADLAGRIGVSRNWVVSIEGGRPGAEVGLVLNALQVLDLSFSVSARAPSEERDDSDPSLPEGAPARSNAQVEQGAPRGPALTRRGRPLSASRRPRG